MLARTTPQLRPEPGPRAGLPDADRHLAALLKTTPTPDAERTRTAVLRAEHCGAGLGPLLPFSETGIVGPCRGRSGGVVPIAEPAPRNRFLAVLGADDLRRLAPDLVRAPAQRGTVLLETEQETRFVWFPESCVISLVTTTREGETAETATVGREGVAGLFAALGDGRSIATGVVQVPGEVW